VCLLFDDIQHNGRGQRKENEVLVLLVYMCVCQYALKIHKENSELLLHDEVYIIYMKSWILGEILHCLVYLQYNTISRMTTANTLGVCSYKM
jgi:hypothetical protein